MTEKIDEIYCRYTRNFSGDDFKSFKIIRGTVGACTSNINENSAIVPVIDYTLHTLHFASCKRIQDSPGFWIPDYRWWIPGFFISGTNPTVFWGEGRGVVELNLVSRDFPAPPIFWGENPWEWGCLELNYGFQGPGFRIPQSKISRIPECGLPYMGRLHCH